MTAEEFLKSKELIYSGFRMSCRNDNHEYSIPEIMEQYAKQSDEVQRLKKIIQDWYDKSYTPNQTT